MEPINPKEIRYIKLGRGGMWAEAALERGVRNPTVLVLEGIAQALGVPTSRLLEETPERKKSR